MGEEGEERERKATAGGLEYMVQRFERLRMFHVIRDGPVWGINTHPSGLRWLMPSGATAELMKHEEIGMPEKSVIQRKRAISKSTTHRLQRFRERHPRIDFYPSPDVLAILIHHRKAGADPTLAGIMDGLIRVGHRAVTGNARN